MTNLLIRKNVNVLRKSLYFLLQHCLQKLESRSCVLSLGTLLILCAACAREGVGAADMENAKDDGVQSLPDSLLGTWVPYGRGYKPFGSLIIESERLSWSECSGIPYRVFKKVDDTYYIEQKKAPPCYFEPKSPYLILVLKKRALEVSICGEEDEFDRPPAARYCSRGILYKENRDRMLIQYISKNFCQLKFRRSQCAVVHFKGLEKCQLYF